MNTESQHRRFAVRPFLNTSALLLSAILLAPQLSPANERSFTYTYESSVLNAGQREIEIWNTFHWQRQDYYRRFRHRVEYEVGLGGNLQTAFYLNLTNTAKQEGSGSTAFLEKEIEVGFSNEWKYKLSDPVANVLGFALYGEVGVTANEVELEGKIILDKKIGSTLQALNLVFEPEWETEIENGKTATGYAFSFECDYGFSYRLSDRWNLGVELRNHNEYTKDGRLQHSTLFGGPVVSYATEGFWITLTALPQLYAFRALPGNKNSHRELRVHEQLETRMIFSYEF